MTYNSFTMTQSPSETRLGTGHYPAWVPFSYAAKLRISRELSSLAIRWLYAKPNFYHSLLFSNPRKKLIFGRKLVNFGELMLNLSYFVTGSIRAPGSPRWQVNIKIRFSWIAILTRPYGDLIKKYRDLCNLCCCLIFQAYFSFTWSGTRQTRVAYKVCQFTIRARVFAVVPLSQTESEVSLYRVPVTHPLHPLRQFIYVSEERFPTAK